MDNEIILAHNGIHLKGPNYVCPNLEAKVEANLNIWVHASYAIT